MVALCRSLLLLSNPLKAAMGVKLGLSVAAAVCPLFLRMETCARPPATSHSCRYCCKSRLATPLTKQWNQNYRCRESKLRLCSLRRFNLARQDLQNTLQQYLPTADNSRLVCCTCWFSLTLRHLQQREARLSMFRLSRRRGILSQAKNPSSVNGHAPHGLVRRDVSCRDVQ